MEPTASAISMTIGLLFAVALLVLLSGCVSVGKGSATLIPAKPREDGEDGFKQFFPDLVSKTESMRPLTPGADTNREKYTSYLEGKLGCEPCKTSELSVVIRDRTKIPPFLPVDVSIEKQLLPIYLDKDLSSAKKEALAEAAKASVFNVPDLANRTAFHDAMDGKRRYFYYPRIQVDFSSKLNTPSQLDRFAYLGMALKLKEDADRSKAGGGRPNLAGNMKDACERSSVRIIDFQPKASDILEFTRGELTQKAELDAKASMSDQDVRKFTGGTVTGTATQESTQISSGSERSRSTTLTPDISLSMSETFVNALKDSIEARTAGILEKGNVLFADFKAIKNKRIGGTYTFDVMLEVPTYIQTAEADTDVYSSIPCVTEIKADAYLVSVVRHVYKPGTTGWWTKVPEPENDKSYYQVVVEHVPDISLWKYNGVTWAQSVSKQSVEYTISVVTNRSDARYVVKVVGAEGLVLGDGSGMSSKIVVVSPPSPLQVRVEFLDVIDTVKDTVHVFSSPPSEAFRLDKEQGGQITIVGNYRPKIGKQTSGDHR